jgi:hypothetical protein
MWKSKPPFSDLGPQWLESWLNYGKNENGAIACST